MIRAIGLRFVVALGLLAFLLFPVLAAFVDDGGSSGYDPVTITAYEADYEVAADGTLTATETLTTNFPLGRHGIFRYWDVADAADHTVRYRPRDIEITLDGSDVPVEMMWENGRRYRVAKIGDADSTLTSGTHTYEISYRIDGVLAANTAAEPDGSASWTDGDGDRSQFVWQVVAAGWSMPIERADISVSLPTTPDITDCIVADGRSCDVETDGSTLSITAEGLGAHNPLTVRAAMDEPAPDRASVPWSVAWDRLLGDRWWPAAVAALVSVAALALGWTVGRSAREPRPGYPVVYEPPAGLGPVQTVYVKDEVLPQRATSATLLHLAETGSVDLTETNGRWTITSKIDSDAWDDLDPVAQRVGHSLGIASEGATFSPDGSVDSGRKLATLESEISATTRTWAESTGATVSARSEALWRLAFWAAVALVVVGAFMISPSLVLLPLAAFAVGAATLLLPGVGSRRTVAGRDLWSRSGGFQRFLSTDSAKDRFDFSGREDLYTAYIPYAVAFGVADRWARKYETSTGQTAPMPLWYGGGSHTAGTGYFGGGDAFSSFESSLSSSISAYQATQRASSSSGGGFGGGGGFSGGGGGGGGGGSW